LNVALDRLEQMNPRQRQVVELRYFGGLSVEETAEVLHISSVTVKRDWVAARAWLKAQIRPEALS
jgi:RNA polymerase sigma factor (sigma-70 family)